MTKPMPPAQVRALRLTRANEAVSRSTRFVSLRPQAEASTYINALLATVRALIDEIERSPLPAEPPKGESK